jgi:hypothetical protein
LCGIHNILMGTNRVSTSQPPIYATRPIAKGHPAARIDELMPWNFDKQVGHRSQFSPTDLNETISAQQNTHDGMGICEVKFCFGDGK